MAVDAQHLVSGKHTSHSGLRSECLSFTEVLGQSIANIAPSATPALVIPLVFATAGNGTWLAYLFATIAIGLIAINLNHFTQRSASPGSLYSFIARGLGPVVGTIAGWALALAYILTASAVICGFANYAIVLSNHSGVVPSLIFAVIGSITTWYIAAKDIKLSAKFMLGFELVSLSLIFLLAVLVLAKHGFAIDHAQLSLKGVSFDSIRIGLVLAFFSFTGFESAASLGDEARNPLRTIPRSVIFSALFVGAFFVLLSYTQVLGFAHAPLTLDKDPKPLGTLADLNGLSVFGSLISVGALVSFWACILACVNSGARIIFTMGRHGLFHSSIGQAHETNETPHIAVTIAAIAALVPPVLLIVQKNGLFDIYGWVGTVATFGFLFVYGLIAIAAPVYLKREGELKPWHVVLSIVTVLVLLIPAVGSVYPLPPAPYKYFSFVFLAWLVAGGVFYAVRRSSKKGLAQGINEDLDEIHTHFRDVRVNGGGEGI